MSCHVFSILFVTFNSILNPIKYEEWQSIHLKRTYIFFRAYFY
jgi:hypothetical protein